MASVATVVEVGAGVDRRVRRGRRRPAGPRRSTCTWPAWRRRCRRRRRRAPRRCARRGRGRCRSPGWCTVREIGATCRASTRRSGPARAWRCRCRGSGRSAVGARCSGRSAPSEDDGGRRDGVGARRHRRRRSRCNVAGVRSKLSNGSSGAHLEGVLAGRQQAVGDRAGALDPVLDLDTLGSPGSGGSGSGGSGGGTASGSASSRHSKRSAVAGATLSVPVNVNCTVVERARAVRRASTRSTCPGAVRSGAGRRRRRPARADDADALLGLAVAAGGVAAAVDDDLGRA